MHNRSPEAAKSALFRTLFATRIDIYTTRLDNPHTGKHGWIPAVRGTWRKGSLHCFSDQSIAAIAEGKLGDVAAIKAGIEAAVQVIPAVEVNLLFQPQNAHEANIAFFLFGLAEMTGTDLQDAVKAKLAVNQGCVYRKPLKSRRLPAAARPAAVSNANTPFNCCGTAKSRRTSPRREPCPDASEAALASADITRPNSATGDDHVGAAAQEGQG